MTKNTRSARRWPGVFFLAAAAGLAPAARAAAPAADIAPAASSTKAAPAAPAGQAAPAASIPFQTYTLPNGLQVILNQDHRVPEVAVDVWYRVGSKDEVKGRTGFAHLFEHMMFQGSKHVPEDQHFALLQKAGFSNANGTTSQDRTNYYEVVPSNQLELALWLESDRMGFLLDRPTFTESFENQRKVVKNERRQSYENRPMGEVPKVQSEALFPPEHPYHHQVIGSMADLDAASVEDVKRFFRIWYAPGNACLVVAGDFDAAAARALIEKYFGPIPAGPAGSRLPAPLPPQRAQRVTMEAKIQYPHLFVTWVTPPIFAPGDHELDILGSILGGGKSSRLYRRLVYDLKIAQSVSAAQDSQRLASTFEIDVQPMPGHTPDELLAVIDEELQKLRSEPVTTEEVDRARNQLEAQTVRSLEPVLGRAERLQSYAAWAPEGDPGFLERDLEMYRQVDAAAIQRVAREHLSAEGRLVLVVEANPKAPIAGRLKAAPSEEKAR